MARDFNIQNVIIYSDSLLLVNMINEVYEKAWIISPIIQATKKALAYLNQGKMVHLWREANQVADWLAAWLQDGPDRIISPSQVLTI